MPGKSSLAALLAFALFTEQAVAQQHLSSRFGRLADTEGLSASATETGGPRIAREGAPSPRGASGLVRPSIHETPDRDVSSVQPVSHTAPVDRSGADQEDGTGIASGDLEAAPEPADSAPAESESDGERGFPSLNPPDRRGSGDAGRIPSAEGMGAVVTVISSLAVVLGLFFITAWMLRRTGSGGLATLPGDVFEPLGRAPLSSRQQVHLLRCGPKLILVSVTPDGAETLTEIDDPDDVTRLTGLCKANQSGSATAAFRQVLHQFAGQPAEPGFVGRTDTGGARHRLPSEREDLHG